METRLSPTVRKFLLFAIAGVFAWKFILAAPDDPLSATYSSGDIASDRRAALEDLIDVRVERAFTNVVYLPEATVTVHNGTDQPVNVTIDCTFRLADAVTATASGSRL